MFLFRCLGPFTFLDRGELGDSCPPFWPFIPAALRRPPVIISACFIYGTYAHLYWSPGVPKSRSPGILRGGRQWKIRFVLKTFLHFIDWGSNGGQGTLTEHWTLNSETLEHSNTQTLTCSTYRRQTGKNAGTIKFNCIPNLYNYALV